MHVALVVPGGVDRGGQDRVIPALLWLIEGLAERHRVTVVALGQEPTASRYSLCGATVINVPPEQRGPHRLARQIARAVRATGAEGRPDVVHGLWASVSGLSAVLAGRRHRVPSLVHVAGGELVAMPELGYGGALGRGGRAIARLTLRWATDLTVATDWMADHVEGATAAMGRRRRPGIVVLGVDISRFSPATAGATAEPTGLVHVASLNRIKDQTTLLHAVALVRERVPSVTIDLVGVDTLNGDIQRLAVALGIEDATRFHGFVRSSEVPDLYRRAQLHVIASLHEAGPVSVLEAAACGIPTVGTRVGHIADLAKADPPGALGVDPGDAASLAAGIIELLGDDVRRRAMGEQARVFAVAHDAAAMVSGFEARYHSLIRCPDR